MVLAEEEEEEPRPDQQVRRNQWHSAVVAVQAVPGLPLISRRVACYAASGTDSAYIPSRSSRPLCTGGCPRSRYKSPTRRTCVRPRPAGAVVVPSALIRVHTCEHMRIRVVMLGQYGDRTRRR
eukprot:3914411-Rhodomonas_salina.3